MRNGQILDKVLSRINNIADSWDVECERKMNNSKV